QGALAAGVNAINITGVGIASNASGTMNGGIITLTGGTGTVTVGGTIIGTGLFSTTGRGFTNTAAVTGAGITVNHTGFPVAINAALSGGLGAVQINGSTITSNASGTINGGAITLTSGGATNLSATVTGTGTFTSTGSTLNAAAITANLITINHTGLVTFN